MRKIGTTEIGSVIVEMTAAEWRELQSGNQELWSDEFAKHLLSLKAKAQNPATITTLNRLQRMLWWQYPKDVFMINGVLPTFEQWKEYVVTGKKDVELLELRNIGTKSLNYLKELLQES